MKIKKLKIKRILIAIVILIAITSGFIYLINNIKYKKTNEYKLKMIGYSLNEINQIEDNFSKDEINKILSMKYEKSLLKFSNKKFFKFNNLEKYLKYYESNKNLALDNVIAIINTSSDEKWYEYIKNTDINKDKLMLVNRYYRLAEDYVPEDLVLLSTKYSYGGNYASESIVDAIIDLVADAKSDGYTLVISQGYRSYDDQKKAYDSYSKNHTEEETDKFAARAGHSEYQTGLSIIIKPYNKVITYPETNDEYNWLLDNAYKYGFILRYPKDKENITGFNYEPWRYRYVGIQASSIIYDNNITFDEYYSYYMD